MKLRFRRRWAAWWVAAIVATHYAVLAYFLGFALRGTAYRAPGSWLRVFIPLVIVAGYWTLASIFNSYSAVVQPSGVRLTLFPFPTGSGQFIPREEITICYGRQIVLTTEDGWESDHQFNMGVETRDGHQADIHGRYATATEALSAAYDVSRILNMNTAGDPLKVGLVTAADTFPTLRRQVLLWGAISVIALIAGAIWKMNIVSPH